MRKASPKCSIIERCVCPKGPKNPGGRGCPQIREWRTVKQIVEHLSETRAKLSVEVDAKEFEPDYNKAVKEVAKQVQIPGFRPGKAPRRVVESKIGRGYVIEQAINDNLDKYYQAAVAEAGIRPMSRPEVDIDEVPADASTSFKFTVVVDVRPDIWLPNPADFTVTVPSAEITDEDVDKELDALRERFATFTNVDRAAAEGDYLTIDMVATIDGEEVDDVEGISYHIGDNNMLEGQDEALTGAKAGDEVRFTAKLAGGEHEGEEADILIRVHSVKVSELPEADDEFAQLASEFDTVEELRADLTETAKKNKSNDQLSGAYQDLENQLMEASDFPLPENTINEEVDSHLRNEGLELDDPHGKEIRPEIERQLRQQLLLDAYAEAFKVDVPQEELLEFIFTQAQMYGMDPSQFIQAAAQANQINAFSAELARNKALIAALRLANVKDESGAEVNVAEILGDAPENEVVPEFTEKPAKKADDATESEEAPAEAEAAPAEAEEAPAAKKADAKAEDEAFDPSAHTIDEVLAYVETADEAEKARVTEAEKAGKARKTLLAKLG